jgi:glycosyltransferase involved in cell wall biosynthesis
MRIAYFSPLNPVPSGISDYSEDLLPYLGTYAEVDLFVDRGYRPDNSDITDHFRVYRYDRYARLRRRRGYDATLYHVGNSPAHDYILSTLERFPGVVVLHDYILHHLMLWRAFRHGDGMAYHDAMVEYGESAWKLALRQMRGQLSEEAFQYPLCEPVIAAATAVIGHSRYVVDRVRKQRPEVPTAVVPMGVPRPALADREQARRQLDLAADALVLASFGHVNPYKRLEPALRAFRRLRETYPRALFVLVGSISEHLDLAGLLRRLDLQEAVRVTGYAELGTFLGYMAASDICVNLRYPTAGETSASLLRILGAGLPTLVSRTGSFAELPADVAIQVDTDEYEEEELYAFLGYLTGHPEARRVLGETARRYVTEQHTLEGAAAGTIRFLGQLCGEKVPEEPLRPPPFLPRTGRPAPLPEGPPSLPPLEEELLPYVGFVGKALAEIGLEETDQASLEAVSETLAGLPELFERDEGSAAE